jgi:hypothetical protein
MSSTIGISPPITPGNITGANASILALATMGLSSNKYILGLMILLINLGARYIGNELNEFSQKVLNHKFARRFLIFLVIWMGSRDLLVAFIITVGFILISNTLLNENSDYCILPIDNPTIITKEEYDIAKQMVQKYEESQQYIPISLNIQQTNNNSNNLKSEQSTSIGNNSIKT